MAKSYSGPWVLRSLLFTPGHNQRFVQKAFASAADCIVLDLEDAVPDRDKIIARQCIKDFLVNDYTDPRPVFVRINPMDTGLTLADLDGVVCRQLAGFVYPKALNANHIIAFDAQLALKEMELGLDPGHFDVIVLMETPQSILNAFVIASASPRVIGLLFGCEDFLTDMRGKHGPGGRSLLAPRNLVAMAARAAGVAPIDTPYVFVSDEAGLDDHIQQAVELGFEGMLVMTPRQIAQAHQRYTPSDEEVTEATTIVESADIAAEDSRGITVTKDLFVSPPTVRRSRDLLARRRTIDAFERYVGRGSEE